MRRRAFLSVAAGVVLAGCGDSDESLGDAGDQEAPANDSGGTASERDNGARTGESGTEQSGSETDEGAVAVRPPDPEREPLSTDDSDETTNTITAADTDRTFALLGFENVRHPLSLDARFSRGPRADSPAVIEATVTNTGDSLELLDLGSFTVFADEGSAGPTGYADVDPVAGEGLKRLVVPTAEHDFVDRAALFDRDGNGVWRKQKASEPDVPSHVRLQPGDTLYGQWAFVGKPGRAGEPIPVGAYEFGRNLVRNVGTVSPDLTATSRNPVRNIAPEIRVWQTSAPGPSRESGHAQRQVPPLPGTERTVWFHEADTTTPAYLLPSTETGNLPTRVEFTLVNHTDTTVSGDPRDWSLYKLHDVEWIQLYEPDQSLELYIRRAVRPGGTGSWAFRGFNGDRFEDRAWALDSLLSVSRPYLGPGLYAYESPLDNGDWTLAVLLEFEGTPVEVAPEPGIESERDGSVVRATAPIDETAVQQFEHTLVVERIDSPDTVDERFIPERVMQPEHSPLRNALGLLADGVETVRLATPTVPDVLAGATEQTIIFESQTEREPLRVRTENS